MDSELPRSANVELSVRSGAFVCMQSGDKELERSVRVWDSFSDCWDQEWGRSPPRKQPPTDTRLPARVARMLDIK